MVKQSSIFIFSVCFLFSCDSPVDAPKQTTFDRSDFGAKFQAINANHFKPPTLSKIEGSYKYNGNAIWGATGRDRQGKIYFGVSNLVNPESSAYLYQLDPNTQDINLQSDTVSQLKQSGKFTLGMGQNKLHSKFYQASDGYLYFSSFDEQGESNSRIPQYGGVLWRKLPERNEWEFVFSSDEALIALNSNGRYVYALGYWGHVLYQYDTELDSMRKIAVGSIPGHISRNFLVNRDGHVFIPKVYGEEPMVELVEYSPKLHQVNTFPFDGYTHQGVFSNHGIVSYVNMKNGDIYFMTATGILHRIEQTKNGRSKVVNLGSLDENGGNTYVGALFSPDGAEMIVGLGRDHGDTNYYWILYNIAANTSVKYPILDVDLKGHLLYGSFTTDNNGNFYIVGSDRRDNSKHYPVIFKASY
ncbi:hypothetical protein [Agaribacter flavus]|uniref:Lipoprotein n=1 Tax=Agaribacter flavus TaxID=1902781 RepID=A0ABV7FNN1_9ALTE